MSKSRRIFIKGLTALIVVCVLFTTEAKAAGYTKPLSEVKFADYDKVSVVHIGSEDVEIRDFYDEYLPSQMHHLVAFEVEPDNPTYTAFSGCLYDKEKTLLVCFPQGLRAAEIPKTCVNILPKALAGCSRSIRRQVKAAITKNNGGKWPGYYRYTNDDTNTGKVKEDDTTK